MSNDYYKENGNFVFTEHFLKKRGYCCRNGCRHCPYDFKNNKVKIISLVPSWTETLALCDLEIVGRTRYCIHPDTINNIHIVGGTKDIDLKKIESIDYDYILVDKEENPKDFVTQLKGPFLVSHVKDLLSFQNDLIEFNKKFNNGKINDLICKTSHLLSNKITCKKVSNSFPGIIQWINIPKDFNLIKKVIYLIWKDPWMTVSKNTFIGSQLRQLGYESYLVDFNSPYPEIDLKEYDKKSTLLLFSSEPYPFKKHLKKIQSLNFPSILVDGEKYSWFGVRSIDFLAEHFCSNNS